MIEVIMTETPSISQLKRQIHSLRSTYDGPELLNNGENITFSHSELAPTTEACCNSVVIEASLTTPGIDNCLVKKILVDTGA